MYLCIKITIQFPLAGFGREKNCLRSVSYTLSKDSAIKDHFIISRHSIEQLETNQTEFKNLNIYYENTDLFYVNCFVFPGRL